MFDVFASLAGLIVLFPVMLIAMVAIRIDSPGPIFFRQTRVGRYGRPFRIHKLRTMYMEEANGGSQITVGDDSRITGVGRILRKHKVDELPQLIDVLIGDMSFVGPRPEVPKYVAHYPEKVRTKILSVRPGLTDLSSLRFFDEAAILGQSREPEREYVEKILPQKLALSCEYVDRRSLGRDLLIIAATLRRLLPSL